MFSLHAIETEKKAPRENFIFTDEYNLLYHFYVEGRTIKEVATVPPDVRTNIVFFLHLIDHLYFSFV